jgi:hypothetical protein
VSLRFLAACGIAVFLMVVALAPICCGVNEADAVRTFEAAGLEKATLTGYGWLECGEDDDYRSLFAAINAKGQPVEGAVCCSSAKRCTLWY